VNILSESSGDPAERRKVYGNCYRVSDFDRPNIRTTLDDGSNFGHRGRRCLAEDSCLLFSSEGYAVDVVPDAICGLERLRQGTPDAVVLDLPRPGSSGRDIYKKIANLIPGLPLLILSGSSDVADKVLLLEMGADDYVTVPFSPRELVARLRALMRRASRATRDGVYIFADVMVDSSKSEITRGGQQVLVTPKEFKTLEFLTKNAQRVISRDELLDKDWGYQNYPCTRTVDNPYAEATTETGEGPYASATLSHRIRSGLQVCALSKEPSMTRL
jgi:DNA-binding response OmpR family regulator